MSRFEFDPQRYPSGPGCYLMKDADGNVLYVGKAKNVRRRLASYFRPSQRWRRTRRLVARVTAIDVILVNNETESLVLENNLIKRHNPRFNRMLRSPDSGYFYIVLTGEDPPRLAPYRKRRVNKWLEGIQGQRVVKRFGPYVGRDFRDTLLDFVNETYQLRTCRPLPKRTCLRYHIGRCSAICEEMVTPQAYASAVAKACAFLTQGDAELIQEMKRQMGDYADRLAFEQAGRIRDRVDALERTLQKQIVERDVAHDQAVIVFGERATLVMTVERGAVQGLELCDLVDGDGQPCSPPQFLLARFAQGCPEEVIVNRLHAPDYVSATLSAANGYSVRVTLPDQGVRHELLKLCAMNYAYRVARPAAT